MNEFSFESLSLSPWKYFDFDFPNSGHALLVGCEGCGKKSTTKLAAFAAGTAISTLSLAFPLNYFYFQILTGPDCSFFEIIQRNGLSEKQVRKEMQTLFRRIGIDKVKTTFMIPIDQVRNVSLIYFTSSNLTFIHRVQFQLDDTTEYLLEIVNKIITVGVADDLFTQSEKDQIIDEWNKNVNGDACKQ